MDALLKGLHGSEGLIRIPEKNYCRMAALRHGHPLKRLQGEVFADVIGGKKFLEDHDLIADLAKADEEIAMCGGGVDFVAQLGQSSPGSFQPFRSGKGEQGRFVGGADKI